MLSDGACHVLTQLGSVSHPRKRPQGSDSPLPLPPIPKVVPSVGKRGSTTGLLSLKLQIRVSCILEKSRRKSYWEILLPCTGSPSPGSCLAPTPSCGIRGGLAERAPWESQAVVVVPVGLCGWAHRPLWGAPGPREPRPRFHCCKPAPPSQRPRLWSVLSAQPARTPLAPVAPEHLKWSRCIWELDC